MKQSKVVIDDEEATLNTVETSRLLEQTIRFHGERSSSCCGVTSCELWVVTSMQPNAMGDDGNFDPKKKEKLIRPIGGSWNHTLHTKQENACEEPTCECDDNADSLGLEAKMIDLLWRDHNNADPDSNDRSHPSVRVRWRRFGTNVNDEDNCKSHSCCDWIASIWFEVPTTTASPDACFARVTVRGMVCWIFSHDIFPSSESQSPQRNSAPFDDFLVLATDHIAATYAFQPIQHPTTMLSIPNNAVGFTTSASNRIIDSRWIGKSASERKNTERFTSDPGNSQKELKPKKRRMPPELCYNDEEFRGEEFGFLGKPMSALEIHGIDEDVNDDDGEEAANGPKLSAKKVIGDYVQKFKGGGHHPPQPLCWTQTLFTFIGTFVTIYLIDSFNQPLAYIDTYVLQDSGNASKSHSAQDTALQMAPFGAACVLLFAMTTAAPSQPRSTICGIMIGMVVGKLVGYMDARNESLGWRMALATATTAAIMGKTCTIYPPGGALALIFSSGILGWEKVLFQVLGVILALTLGVIINNLHPNRRYPTFWLGVDDVDCTRRNTTKRQDDNDNDNDNDGVDPRKSC